MFDDDELMIADGLNDAILGIGYRCGQPDIVAYDAKKVIAILMERDDMSHEDATEHFYVNIQGSWIGEQTPIWIHTEED